MIKTARSVYVDFHLLNVSSFFINMYWNEEQIFLRIMNSYL